MVASCVLNSLLSAHTCLRQTAINSVIVASSTSSPRKKHVTSAFFTPAPRRGKGKERATPPTDRTCLEQISKCQEWVCFSARHSRWCPIHCRRLMLEEFFLRRDRTVRPELCRVPCSVHSLARTDSNRVVHNLQRRHASHTSEPLRMIAPQFSSLGGERTNRPGTPNSSGSILALSSKPQEVAERMKRMSSLEHPQFGLAESWNAYLAAVESDVLPVVPLNDVLDLMEKMVRTVERQYQDDLNQNTLRAWGRRLSEALRTIESCTASSSTHDRRRHCLLARSASMLDDSDRALELLHIAQAMAPLNKDDCDSASGYEAIILSLHRNHDVVRILDFLMLEWNFIEPLLYNMASKPRMENPAGRSLRVALHRIFASVSDPVELITRGQEWRGAQQEKRGHILVELLCEMRRPFVALDVYHEMLNQELYISADIKYLLVLSLARANGFEAANKIYQSLSKSKSKPTQYHLTVGLQLYAQQGDHIRAEQYFIELAEHGWDSGDAKAMYMYSHAVQGNTKETLALFDKFYPVGPNGERVNFPDRFTLTMLIHGVARRGDLERINHWLQIMSKAGYKPDVYIYGSILKSFAIRDDMISIAAVLSQMCASGVMPNVVTYNTIMSVLARRGDADGAEAIYERAIREGITPDRQMITTLMNAHVEAGSWEGVIRMFNRFKSTFSHHAFGFGAETYNTLLKAYVRIGAPYRLVSRIFDKLKSSHMNPDAYTYSLLIQSACDAGLVNVATNIFREMDQLPQSDKLVTVYCLTIIMGGFIRARNLSKARAILDEMIQRGIEPTSVSIGTLLKTFGLYNRTRTLEGLALAEGFIRSLSPRDADWSKLALNRPSALQHVYGPLLHAYSREGRSEDVERLHQEMLDAGGRPTLGTLTLLLDSYRRDSKHQSVQQLWSQIFRLALEYTENPTLANVSSSAKSDLPNSRFKDSILCVPLSIYIDATSAAGLHAQVADVWQEYAAHGFGFDSHNWNHLVVALVRAGDVERSFEIVEKVILPNWKRWQTSEDRLLDVISSIEEEDRFASSGVFDVHGDDMNVAEAERRRRSKGKVSGSARKLARLNPDIKQALFGDGSDDKDDVALPLHLLQKIAPTSNLWRPHKSGLQLLSMVMARLDSGHLIEPVRLNSVDVSWDNKIDPDAVSKTQEQARTLLERIYQNYPETVQILMTYNAMGRRLLGNKEYGERHTWI